MLSFLPEKDAARTSVLSKAWADTWYTFPILSFCDTNKVGDSVKNKKNFIDYVNRSLGRFSDQGMLIKEFKLSMNHFETHMSKDIDLWLKFGCERGVEVLKLSTLNYPNRHYVLPMRVIEAKSITKLVLKGSIQVDQHTIEHLISYSPLIEDITLNSCLVLSTMSRTINISSDRLKKLKLSNCFYGIKEVNIDAPNQTERKN